VLPAAAGSIFLAITAAGMLCNSCCTYKWLGWFAVHYTASNALNWVHCWVATTCPRSTLPSCRGRDLPHPNEVLHTSQGPWPPHGVGCCIATARHACMSLEAGAVGLITAVRKAWASVRSTCVFERWFQLWYNLEATLSKCFNPTAGGSSFGVDRLRSLCCSRSQPAAGLCCCSQRGL
jgi:hypothetical protein